MVLRKSVMCTNSIISWSRQGSRQWWVADARSERGDREKQERYHPEKCALILHGAEHGRVHLTEDVEEEFEHGDECE